MHKTLPLVSLAIPIFNGAEFMRYAIDSAIAQTYPHIEIIVINDGSNDNGKTEEIALSYGDRISYYSKKNGGVGSALNLALKKSSGEYFCWLSHDDLYLPEKVARQVEFLQSLPTKDAVVFCRHNVIDANGELLHVLPSPPKFNPITAAYQLLLNQWMHCCSVLAPRSLYLEMGQFREDLLTTQDYDLLMKIGLHYPFYEIPDVLLYARSHPNQGYLTVAHQVELEQFFVEHIPMLSSEYMRRCFSSQEIFDSWVELIFQLRARKFTNAVNSAFCQLLKLDEVRANPSLLLLDDVRLTNDVLSTQLNHLQVEVSLLQAQIVQLLTEQTKLRTESGLLQSQVAQLLGELNQ